jgi:hypothetical protein
VLGCASSALTQLDCPSGELCADAPPAPFETTACVSSSGNVACPASYTQKHIVYSSFTDNRGCSSCSCTVPMGIACTGTAKLDVFTDNACVTLEDTFNVNGTCASQSGPGSDTIASMRLAGVSLPNNFACTTSGGQPTGSATATGATTVCCLP